MSLNSSGCVSDLGWLAFAGEGRFAEWMCTRVKEIELIHVECLSDVCLTAAVFGLGPGTQANGYRPLWSSIQSAHEMGILVP